MAHLILKPVSLRDANAFVAAHHAHHSPVRGCTFSVGCFADKELVGVVTVGRPSREAA